MNRVPRRRLTFLDLIPNCSQSVHIITAQSDASLLSTCITLSGSISVSPSFSGGILSLYGPAQITGGIFIEDVAGLTSFESSSLTTIGGQLILTNLTQFHNFSFVSLTSVGELVLSKLSILSTLSVGIPFIATSANISDTVLSELPALVGNIETIHIENNNGLLNSPSLDLNTVNGSLDLVCSNTTQESFAFPYITWAKNITNTNCAGLDLPQITTVNGSLGLYNSTSTLFSVPELSVIGSYSDAIGSLALIDNQEMTGIYAPLLMSIGGDFRIASNSKLSRLSLPGLGEVGGSILLNGRLLRVNLPALSVVEGDMIITSSDDNFNCSLF
ncbi:hypothetical protein BDZ45DRAFT_595485, partial [Acephala macrosclerotiorum]